VITRPHRLTEAARLTHLGAWGGVARNARVEELRLARGGVHERVVQLFGQPGSQFEDAERAVILRCRRLLHGGGGKRWARGKAGRRDARSPGWLLGHEARVEDELLIEASRIENLHRAEIHRLDEAELGAIDIEMQEVRAAMVLGLGHDDQVPLVKEELIDLSGQLGGASEFGPVAVHSHEHHAVIRRVE
jgi:hypothetical protein